MCWIPIGGPKSSLASISRWSTSRWKAPVGPRCLPRTRETGVPILRRRRSWARLPPCSLLRVAAMNTKRLHATPSPGARTLSTPTGCRAQPVSDYVDAMLAMPVRSDGPRGHHARPERIGFHPAHYNTAGKLLPWLPLGEVVEREIAWYKQCDVEKNGYPSWVYATFIDDDYRPFKTDFLPGCQNGMGILSYLKYWMYTGKTDDWVLAMARQARRFPHSRGAYARRRRVAPLHPQHGEP